MAILNTNISECNARLVTISGQPQDAGFIIKRCWPWLQGSGAKTNDTHINTLYRTIAAVETVTNPKANNDSYAGLFVASVTLVKDENEDGTESRASSIVQTLTKVKTVTTEASMGTPDKGSDFEIIHYLDIQPGTDEHCYYIYRNLNPASRATAMTVSVSVPSGYTAELKREFKVETDKTGTLYIVFIKRTWRGWTDTGADLKNYDNYHNAEASINGLWARVKVADKSTAASKLLAATATKLKTDTNFRVDALIVSENGNGSLNFHRTDQKVIYQHSECWWTTRYGRDWFAWGRNGTDTQFNAVVTKIGGITSSTANSVHKTPNKYTTPAQLYDWSISKSAYSGADGSPFGESAGSGHIHYIQYGQVFDKTEQRTMRKKRLVTQSWSRTWHYNYSQAHSALDGYDKLSKVITSRTGLYGAVKFNLPSTQSWITDE